MCMLIRKKEPNTSPRLAFVLRAVSEEGIVYPLMSEEPLTKNSDFSSGNEGYFDPYWNPNLPIGTKAGFGMLHCIPNIWDAFNSLLYDGWKREGEPSTEVKLFLVRIPPSPLIYKGVHYMCSEELNYKAALGVQSYKLIKRFGPFRPRPGRTNSGIYFYRFPFSDEFVLQGPYDNQPWLKEGVPNGLFSPLDTAEILAATCQHTYIYKDHFLKELGGEQ